MMFYIVLNVLYCFTGLEMVDFIGIFRVEGNKFRVKGNKFRVKGNKFRVKF